MLPFVYMFLWNSLKLVFCEKRMDEDKKTINREPGLVEWEVVNA